MKLSVVVPCYNEDKNIPLILSRFKDVILRNDIELILVNNGSTDNSEAVLESLLPQYPFARLENIKINQGYGFGVLSGVKAAKGDYIAWTHADMQTDPYDTIRALELIEKSPIPQKTFVKGKRKKRSFVDGIFTFGMSVFETLYLRTQLNDINAQPNLFHRSFIKFWQNPPFDFSLDLYVFYMARRQKMKIIRFPVLYEKRIYGHSHWNTGLQSKYKFIRRTLEFSHKLKKNINPYSSLNQVEDPCLIK